MTDDACKNLTMIITMNVLIKKRRLYMLSTRCYFKQRRLRFKTQRGIFCLLTLKEFVVDELSFLNSMAWLGVGAKI